ncbi:MAG: acyltransferase [Myxococcales bacterium]|nr:acyltransferase [Myxococcales bacterium]
MLRDKILNYIKMRLYAVSQFPDPQLLHAHGGIGAITRYLKQCGSPTITRETLARFGAKIHPDCQPIGPWITMHEVPTDYSNLEIGAHCHIGKEVFFDLTDKIVIEDGAGVGMRSVILTHLNFDANPLRPVASMVPKIAKPTVIGRGAAVGAGVTILAGVTIGEHSVVGAGCVVTEDVPPFTVIKSPAPVDAYRIPASIMRKVMERAANAELGQSSAA